MTRVELDAASGMARFEPDPPMSSYRFGRFEVRAVERQLLIDGKPAALGARAFDLLMALVEHRDRVVPKSELFDRVWPGLVVEENNLQVQISALRRLLGPQAIATIPGRGYRFSAALDGAAVGIADAAAGSPTARKVDGSAAPLTNLPSELPALYGREADQQALRALIDAHRLVTIVGAGGIGKSRLAQAVAHSLAGRWPDGSWMIELEGLSDPGLLPNVVAQTVDIKLTAQGVAQEEVVAGLERRSLLLLLDNCEHVLDAAAALVQAVMKGAPNVRLLVTSQEPLHVPAEQQYRVVPLAVPSQAAASGARDYGAVALFEARVRAADPRFALNEDSLPLVIDICRRLDGLPLAIELSAARVATLGLRTVRDKLDARFKLLTGGARTTLHRHQTLRAALEWSHGLLNEAERAVFRRLGVFAGGFTIELAQAVAGGGELDEWAVLDHLSALVDKSLVVADPGDPPRYRLLESTRAFALEQLAAGETADLLRRHALAMRDFLQRVDDANIDGELRTDQYAALILPELDNLRSAHAWATGEGDDEQVAIGLAAHAGSLIDYAFECADWLMPLQRRVEDGAVGPALAARYWRALAAGNMVGRVPLALQAEAATRAKTLYESLGQPRRVFSTLIHLARHRSVQHQNAAAHAALEEARALLRPDWPPEFHILLLRREAFLARKAGRHSAALALYREGVRASALSGDWRLEIIARSNLVDLLWQIGPIEEAAREAWQLVEELRARPVTHSDMATVFASVMGILSEMGRIDEATAAAHEALPIMRRARERWLEEWVYLFWCRDQFDVAAVLLGATDAQRTEELPFQTNEDRLLEKARTGLAERLGPNTDTFASRLVEGAALGDGEIDALIAEALGSDRPGS
jgi:predicted ATPase/DNA-binding winged helix-turn-helix (wHTH) protein